MNQTTFYDEVEWHQLDTEENHLYILSTLAQLLTTKPEPKPDSERYKITIAIEEIKDDAHTNSTDAN